MGAEIFSFPVDGNWGDWGNWSLCSKTCGEGEKVRSRECDNPTPEHGGRTCEGEVIDVDYCNNKECTGKFFIGCFTSFVITLAKD